MWLHLPTSVCSPEPEDSTSPSESLFQDLAASATWNGKEARPASWRRAWKTGALRTLRFGPTSELSQQNSSVAAWMESLGASPVRIYPSQESEKGSLGSEAVFGKTTEESLPKQSPNGCSSKTSADWFQASLFGTDPTSWDTSTTYRTPRIMRQLRKNAGIFRATETDFTGDFSSNTESPHCSMSAAAWKKWVTAWRVPQWRRPTLARRTEGSGSSSSQWTTPMASDSLGEMHQSRRAVEMGFAPRLQDQARAQVANWPTPRSEDSECAGNHPGAVDSLTGAAGLWATPRTITGGGESAERKQELGRAESGGGDLQSQVNLWQTPATDSFRSRGGDRKHEMGLDQQARNSSLPAPPTPLHGPASSPNDLGSRRRLEPEPQHMWGTPKAGSDMGKHNRTNGKTYLKIGGQAEQWRTPNTRDHHKQGPREDHKQRQTTLVDQVEEAGKSKRKLNPAFVCWLMNWPWFWTHPAPLSFARRETASWLSKARLLCESFCGGLD